MWGASPPRKAAPVPGQQQRNNGGPPKKAAPVPDLPGTFQPPKKTAPRPGNSSSFSNDRGPPSKVAPTPFNNNNNSNNSGPPRKVAPLPFQQQQQQQQQSSNNNDPYASGPSSSILPRKSVPQVPYSNNSNTNSALPKRSSFTNSQPEERQATSQSQSQTQSNVSPSRGRGHFSGAAPRRKVNVTNPDNGITRLQNNTNNNNTEQTKNQNPSLANNNIINVSIATLGGAPAKQPNYRKNNNTSHSQSSERGREAEVQLKTSPKQPNEEYINRFSSYLDTKEYSDLVFQYEKYLTVNLDCHRIIVACHSPILRSMINNSSSDNSSSSNNNNNNNHQIITLSEQHGDPRSFTSILSWIYKRETPSISSGALHLTNVMGCATSLQIKELPNVILQDLLEQHPPIIELNNVISVMNVAYFYSLETLLMHCINVCVKEMSNDGFEKMIRKMCIENEAATIIEEDEKRNKSVIQESKKATDTNTETEHDRNDATNSPSKSKHSMLSSNSTVNSLVLRLLCSRTIAPMAMAVRYNLLSIVKTMLAEDSLPNSDLLTKTDEDGARPLELALRLGHDSLVEPLVSAGDKMVVNQRMTPSRRPSSIRPGGTRHDHFRIEAGEQTMLHLAAASGNVRHCRVLIDAGADVNAVNSYGRSPLHLATLSGDLDSLKLLLEKGVAPNLQDANGHTALHLVTGGDLPEDVLDVDLATFDDLNNTTSNSSNSASNSSTESSQGGQQNVQQLSQTSNNLSKKRSETSGEITFNFIPLPLSQAERVVDMLLKTKINVHIPDGKGRTPLHVAVWRGAFNITNRLLNAGADPAIKDYQGNTSLHFAAQTACRDSLFIVQALLGPLLSQDELTGGTGSTGISNTSPSPTRSTSITTLGLKEASKICSPNELNGQNVTPLHVASATCGTHDQSVDVVLLLLKAGGDPNMYDKRGLTPLHMLAASHLPQISNIPSTTSNQSVGYKLAKSIVDAGGSLDRKTGEGNHMTALHIALENSNFDLGNALVRHGAALSIPDTAGRCALSMCIGHAREVNLRKAMLLSCVTIAPYWVPDDALNNCMECGSEFSFSRRRHHCRHCGRLVCPSCSPKKCKIEKLGEKKNVRVCNPCLQVLNSPSVITDVGGNGGGFPEVTGGR